MLNMMVDDCRLGPANTDWMNESDKNWQDWIVVRCIENAKMLLKLNLIDDLSLDHDMGTEETGYDLAKWIVETGNWPKGKITVHSSNPVGREAIVQLLNRYRATEIK